MKKFDLPEHYSSNLIKKINQFRNIDDPRKRDFRATQYSLGSLNFIIARSFGFCYGVENAIERSYRAVNEHPDKRIFLLSQMIHNPDVNEDLLSHGIKFLMDTQGNQLISWDEVNSDDIVIIPAFGTSLEIKALLKEKGIEFKTYDTTCPFVTRVWKRAEQLGKKDYNLIIHGKYNHEETRATFSHSVANGEALVIKNMDEAKILAEYKLGKRSKESLLEFFDGKYSENFDPEIHLKRVGVINQTTMLATETAEIASYLESVYKEVYKEEVKNHFADTKDTLCYATNENQESTIQMLKNQADLALVVGGYNSSNTSHLAELCEEKVPTYYIANSDSLLSKTQVEHFNYEEKKVYTTENFLPEKQKTTVYITCGASCPDTVLEKVVIKLASFYNISLETLQEELKNLTILDN
jgi:4-hydroxy-3-methylbut-2-enyl diphosphate reductase